MAAPTLLDYAESSWTDSNTTDTTDDLDWAASTDVAVILGATEDNTVTLATPTGTNISLSPLSGLPTNTGSSCKVYGWSATLTGTGNSTLTSTNGSSGARGLAAWVFSGSDGLGTPVVNVGTGLTVSVTVEADSSVVMVLADWNATADVTVTTEPSGGTIRQNNQVSGLATFLVIQWDSQAAGTRSYGVTAWTGTGTVSKAAVEVLGTASSSTTATAENAPATGTAETPTVAVRPSAENAAATGAAETPTVAVRPSAENAAATGAALDATVLTAVVALAESAAATATAQDATTLVAVSAEAAGAAGAANDATVATDLDTVSCHTDQTPGSGNLDNGDPLTTGVKYLFDAPGTVSAIRFWVPTTNTGTYTVGLYQATNEDDPGPGTGTELATASVASGDVVADGWAEVPITPQDVDPDIAYVAAVHSSSGRFVQTAGALSSPITNAGITTVVSGDDPVGLGTLRNGTFNVGGALAYPATSAAPQDYFVDVAYAAAVGDTTATAECATATGTADDTTVVTGALVVAECATATGDALFDVGSSINLTLVADAPILATATAYDATVSTLATTTAVAECATATGDANAPAAALRVMAEAAAAEALALSATVGGTIVKATSSPAVTAVYTSDPAVTAGHTSTAAVSARRTSLTTVG